MRFRDKVAIVTGGVSGIGRATSLMLAVEEARVVLAGKFGKPEQVAAAICFLASDHAASVTGANLAVDGGRLDQS